MNTKKPSYSELEKKLSRADKLIAKLKQAKSTPVKSTRPIKKGGSKVDYSNAQELIEAYKASEQNFKNSVDACPLGIRIVTNDGKLIYANKAILDICGYKTAEQMAAVPRSVLYTPESYQAHLERKKKRKLNEYVPMEYEISIRRPDGEVRNLQLYRREVMWGGEQQFMAMYEDITESKRAQAALKESEEKFHNIVEHSNDGIVFIQDGIVRYCNSKMLEIGDYQESDVIGKSFIDFIAPEHKKMVYDLYSKRVAGKKVQGRYEATLIGKDGRKIFTEISASLVSLDHEQLDIAIVRDITGRKQAQEALADEAVRRRILVEQSRDGIVILDQDGNVHESNQRFADMLGYTMDEMKQLHVFDWEFQYPHEQVVEMIRTVDEKGDHFETKHRRKDGTIYDVEISTNGAMFAGQKLIFCVCRDITERKQMEETLEESETKYRSIYENSNDAILLTYPDGAVLAANAAAWKMFGKTEEEIIKGGRAGIVDVSDSRLKTALEIRQKTAEYIGELTFLRADGTKFPGYISSKVFLDKDGKEKTSLIIHDITERKRMEEALERDREEIKLIIDSSPALVFYKDLEGKFLRVNRAFAEVMNMPEEDFVGKTVFDLYTADIAQGMADDDRKVFASGRPKLNIIEQYESATGLRWVTTDKIPVLDKDGHPIGLIGFAQDITERKQAEESLKESEERFRTLFETMAQGVIYHDSEGRVISANPAAQRILGLRLDEMIGKTSLDPRRRRLHEDGSKFASEEHPSIVALRTGKPVINVIMGVYNPVEKGYRWILNNAIPEFREGEKKPYRVYTTFTDITERKLAEQRINYLNQTLRSIRDVNQLITREKDRDKLLKGICDTLVESRSFYTAWIVLLDESHKLITHAMSGFGKEPSLEFTPIIDEFKKGNPPPCAKKALKKSQVVTSEDPSSTCVGCPIISESPNFGSMTARLEYDGNIYGVVCASLPKEVLADADEVVLFKEVANDIAFALYNIDRQQEFERLEQERLRSAKLESIGTLAGGIAHDFNNLLTGIMGNIGMVKSSLSPTDKTFEMLDEAEKAAMRSKDLTQQLLTFARGGQPIKRSIEIAGIIRESATFALRGSKVKQELSLPDDLWLIEADEGQISQVINNLVINADEAMPAGGTLKIQAENVTLKKAEVPPLPSGDYVRIDVTDNGVGISSEHHQRIFEPYFTTKQRGSGLGLTTAYSIVRNHGGTITADSMQNQGSTFHIYLPATKKTTKGGKKMIVRSHGQAGGKVLIMDDEEMIRKMLNNMLTLAGYSVELSSDGTEALEKYQAAQKAGDPFNAVIMDLTIPGGMGGKEAIKKLLEIDPDATAIVSSGYATDSIMSEYKKYGFKAVIAKPYSVKQLQETLSSVIVKKKK